MTGAVSAAVIAGCSSANTSAPPTASQTPTRAVAEVPPLDVRPVTSETRGACSGLLLPANGAGMACDLTNSSRFTLGPLAGQLTIAHAALATEFKGVTSGQQVIVVQLDKPSTDAFATLSRHSVGKRLAILVTAGS